MKNRENSVVSICIYDNFDLIMFRFNNFLHREDGPAYITKSGHKQWWLYGTCTRHN